MSAGILQRPVALILASALVAIAATAYGQSPTGTATPSTQSSPGAGANQLDIQVVGLRSNSGEVGCSIFSDHEAYPRDDSKVLKHVWAPIHDHKSDCIFTDLPAGQYAAVVFHDENGNHEFDQNAFGMPEEGYGFSNDAAALFSAPTFDSAAFDYDGKRLYLVVNIRY